MPPPEAARLTPDGAQARFGDLLDPATRTHRHFEQPDGVWRPEMDAGPRGMTLREYRLYPPVKAGPTKVWFKPKPKPR